MKQYYPIMSNKDIQALLPTPRSLFAIQSKARKMHLRKTDSYKKEYLRINQRKAAEALRGHTPWNKKPTVTKICQYCGRTFTVPLRRKERAKFCSRQCANAFKRTITGENHPLYSRITRTCEWCGKKFKAKPAKVAVGEGRFCSRACVAAYVMAQQGGRRSAIEEMVEKELASMGVAYKSQEKIGPWLVDFYLPEHRLVIECDGDYWHNRPEVKRRDKRKNKWLIAHGYTIIRLKEKDIRKDVKQALRVALNGIL